MEFEDIKSILDELESLGVVEISITGGEPLTHPKINDILELIIQKGFNVQICTNGTLIDSSLIKLLQKYEKNFFRFSISLDGIEKVHDEIRGVGCFESVKTNILKLKENNIKFAINSVLTSKSIESLDIFLNQLLNLGVKNCSFNPIRDIGRASKFEYLSIKSDEYTEYMENAIDTLIRFSKEKGMSFYFYRGTSINNGKIEFSQEYPGLLDILNVEVCGAGNIISTIKANGTMLPCVYLDDLMKSKQLKFDSILSSNIKNVWDNNEQFKYIRNIKASETCLKCNLNKKLCSGLCPSEKISSNNTDCFINKFKSVFINKRNQF
ncbi:MAG: radical SAM protein [Paraclostridium sp.]